MFANFVQIHTSMVVTKPLSANRAEQNQADGRPEATKTNVPLATLATAIQNRPEPDAGIPVLVDTVLDDAVVNDFVLNGWRRLEWRLS